MHWDWGALYRRLVEGVLFCVCFFGTGELSTLRRMMEVPNEPGLSPNTGLENTS